MKTKVKPRIKKPKIRKARRVSARKITVVTRVKENDSWDPDYRTEDPEAVCASDSFADAWQAIYDDAAKILRQLGYSKEDDPEWWDSMLDAAGASEWMEPSEGEGRWKWNVSNVRYTGKA